MKPSHFLACAAAAVALAACDSNSGDSATNTPAAADAQPVPPPANGDWTTVVAATPEGGFRMGNPNAPVKLVEFASMTCPHCASFDEEGVPQLTQKYVKSGRLSFELRNYVRDAFDLTATLIARCNGASSFFPLTDALFKDQSNWIEKVQSTPPEQLQQLQSLPPNQQFLALAKVAGFQQWAALRGIPEAKSTQCLTDENSVNQLVQMASDATTQYPNFSGTPSFVINGKLYEGRPDWENLEPAIRDALGERG